MDGGKAVSLENFLPLHGADEVRKVIGKLLVFYVYLA